VVAGVVFDLKHLGSLYPIVQSLDWDYPHNKLLIGTGANEVYEVSDTDGADLNGGPLIQGHFKCVPALSCWRTPLCLHRRRRCVTSVHSFAALSTVRLR
jgi:hypothetical protein